MKITEIVDNSQTKRTKIVATVAGNKCTPAFIQELYNAGMNVVRFNTAHQTPDETLPALQAVREVSSRIAILIDTKGPEVRTTPSNEKIAINEGDVVTFAGGPNKASTGTDIFVNYAHFAEEVPLESHILIDDGKLKFTVIEKKDGKLLCRADNDGVVEGKKSVNVPRVSLNVPALSDKDRDYIHFVADHGIDFIAHSFVRKKEDLEEIQAILDAKKSPAKIIAKIENIEGVENLEEILDHAYGVMVARGDLGVEVDMAKIPVIQKRMVETCINRRKPVIVATQMLESMTDNPRPTRAEVSDVANAVFDGADAIMLSGETAYGKYPIESVSTMAAIAMEAEAEVEDLLDTPPVRLNTEISAYLCKSAVDAASHLDAKAIIADTTGGKTIRNMVGFRGEKHIYALCYQEHVIRELALSYGVRAFHLDMTEYTTDTFLTTVSEQLVHYHSFTKEDLVVIISSGRGVQSGPSFMEVNTMENLIHSHLVEAQNEDS